LKLAPRLAGAARRTLTEPSYAVRRALWEAYTYLPERVVTRDTRHGRMSLRSRDQVIGRLLFVNGAFCIVDIDAVVAVIARERPAPGRRVLLDVGANIGTVCVPLQARGTFARTLAFEPDPANFELLERNLRQNGLGSSVLALQFALSSAEGEATLRRSNFNYGDHRLSARGLTVDHTTEIVVRTRRLDDVLRERAIEAQDVGLLWIDTQGHELDVLRGASSVLEANVPIVTEFWPDGLRDAGADPAALLALLRDHYDRFCVVDARMALRPCAELTLDGLRLPDGSFTDLLVL
jgi:FkbM family methyltransferase